MINHIETPARFLAVAANWYSSQHDLLYAVYSSGGLYMGNIRPYNPDHYMSDEEWYISLWMELSCDLNYAISACRKALGDLDDLDDLVAYEEWVDNVVLPGLEKE